MSSSVNINSTSPSLLVEDGQAFYETHLRNLLEVDHCGEFVAIEPSAARFFLGQTATAALVTARDAMPDSQFFLTHVGGSAAHRIGGHGRGIR